MSDQDSHHVHITYAEKVNFGQLWQGDILKRTDELNEIIAAIHPHFAKAHYSYFAVLTQGCDLYCRDGEPCKAKYITLGAVRPMRVAVNRFIESMLSPGIERTLKTLPLKKKNAVVQFVARVLNNNESDYFHLHKRPDVGMTEDHCVFLRVNIPLKATLHYEKLLKAKIIQIDDMFQTKMGYLLGQAFSRIGTKEWYPDVLKSQGEFDKLVNSKIEQADQFIWFEDEYFKDMCARLNAEEEGVRNIKRAQQIVAEIKAEKAKKKEDTLNKIEEVVREICENDMMAKTVRNRVANMQLLEAVMRK